MKRRPKNLLFVIADQWRGDTFGFAGHAAVKTPHLDAFAAEAVRFSHYFGQASPCGPARASILTGMYMFNHRQVSNGTPLDDRYDNLARAFARQGYDPVLFGYTDSPRDPAAGPERADWICPGFSAREPFLFAEDTPNWRAWLKARGYDDLPLTSRSPYYPATAWDPLTAERYPPSRVAARDTDTVFLFDAARSHIAEMGDQPWFAHIACLRPHPPLYAPAPFDAMYQPDEMPPPGRGQGLDETRARHPFLAWSIGAQSLREYFHRVMPADEISASDDRRMRAVYYGNCSEVDSRFGALIADLKENGCYDDTMIVFTSDHGEQLGDDWLYGRRGYHDGHFHLPLLIRLPGGVAGHGRTVEAFCESVDLLPTILEAFGIERPEQCDGRSLLPWLAGRTPRDWRRDVFYELDFRELDGGSAISDLGLSPSQCHLSVIRDREWKYVHFDALPPLLFDLKSDPLECRNLAQAPEQTARVADYRARMLDRRLQHTGYDLTGYYQPYGGSLEKLAKVTDPGQYDNG
jgi:arylsulfatase A-like enzyme